MKLVKNVLILVLAIIIVFMGVQSFWYKEYYQYAKLEQPMVGLLEGFIPQGITYIEEKQVWLYSGYMNNDLPSRIYVVDALGNERYIELYDENGVYDGHASGISYQDDIVYLASGGSGESNRVYMFSLTEVLNEDTNTLIMENHFHPYTKASYCYVNDGMLWVGEFEDGDAFPTDDSHRVNMNHALIVGYEVQANGLVDEVVDCVLSCGSKVQGMAMDSDGNIVLSSSYGFVSSYLKYYFALDKQEVYSYSIDNLEVPMYILDNASCILNIKAPQMAEGMVYKDNRLYIIYESATLKYYFGFLSKGRYVHSYDL